MGYSPHDSGPIWADGVMTVPGRGKARDRPVWSEEYRPGITLDDRLQEPYQDGKITILERKKPDVAKVTSALDPEYARIVDESPVRLRNRTANSIARLILDKSMAEADANRLSNLLRYDWTGALRRESFLQLHRNAVQSANDVGGRYGFLLIDVDNFKDVNTEFGYTIADKALRGIVESIYAQVKGNLRDTDLVGSNTPLGKYGGDEFMILLPDASLEETVEIGDRLRQAIEKLEVDGLPQGVRVTMGASAYDGANKDADRPIDEVATTVFNQANVALGNTKNRLGMKNTVVPYNPDLDSNEL